MKLISIGTDRKIFDTNSAVFNRALKYAKHTDEMHVVVFSLKKHGIKDGHLNVGNLFLYQTNSKNKLSYIRDAQKIASSIIANSSGWVVTTQDPFETGLVGKRLSKKFGIPFQVQVHTDFLSPYFKKQSFLNRIRLIISKGVIKKTDSIRTVSERIARSLVTSNYKSKAKLHVLPIFVDIKKLKEAEPSFDLHTKYPQFEKIILTTSRLEPERNVSIAISVLWDVYKNYPKTGLVIVGDGSERSKLEEEVKTFGLEKNVVFEGWQNDLVSYYKTADIFLNTTNYEGYGMSLVEASSHGLPIVTTDVGIVGDLLKDNESALVCSVGDKSCITAKIYRLLKDEKLAKTLISGAESSMDKISISENEYIKRYTKLLDLS